ncbi:MAG: hypothetical protein V1784_09820 [bacterium]
MRIISRFCLLTVVVVMVPAAFAGSYPLGVELFGGFDMPLVQEDVGSGPMYGISVRGHLISIFHAQLVFRGSSQGDKDETVTPVGAASLTETLEGGSLTGFGLNVLLAGKKPALIWPYGFVGISTNSFSPGERDKETLLGTSWGGGLAVSLYRNMVYADANASLLVMPIEKNSASRKNLQIGVGLMYMFQIPMK